MLLAGTFVDELVVLVAFSLLVAEFYGLGMVRALRRHLDGGPGDYLLRVIFRFGVIVIIAQILTVGNAVLRLVDYIAYGDTRLLVFLAIETLFAVAFLWTVWELHHLPPDTYSKHAPVEGVEMPECVCKEIDDTVSPTGTPVDKRYDDTPVAPV